MNRELIGSLMMLLSGAFVVFVTDNFLFELIGMFFVGLAVVNHHKFLGKKQEKEHD